MVMRWTFVVVAGLMGTGCHPRNDSVSDIPISGKHLYAVVYGFEYSYRGEADANVTSHSCVCGFIDSKGVLAISPVFESASEFSDGVAAVRLAGVWGFIDGTGQFIFDPVILGLRESCKDSPSFLVGGRWFSEGRARFKRDGKYGFFDKTGHVVIEPRFDYADHFSDGRALVSLDGRCGYVDRDGNVVIALQHKGAESFSEGLAVVYNERLEYSYIDTNGQTVLASFVTAEPFSDGLAHVSSTRTEKTGDVISTGDKEGYIDRCGNVILNPPYQTRAFSEGRAAARIGGKWGFIDKTGRTAVEPRFHEVMPFSDGLAAVCAGGSPGLGGKWGFIDTMGNMVIEPQFEHVSIPFKGPLAYVTFTGGYSGYVDRRGNTVWRCDATSLDDHTRLLIEARRVQEWSRSQGR